MNYKIRAESHPTLELEKALHKKYNHPDLCEELINRINKIAINPKFESELIQRLKSQQKLDTNFSISNAQGILYEECLNIYSELKSFPRNELFTTPSISWNKTKNQYHQWLFGGENSKGIIYGDFGNSLIDKLSVSEKIVNGARWTFSLGSLSILLTFLISIPIGILLSKKRNTMTKIVDNIVVFVYSIPTFWLSLLALSFLCNPDFLKIFPPGAGFMNIDPFEGIWYTISKNIYYLILPALCWSSSIIAYLIIQVKEASNKVRNSYQYRTALARGIKSSHLLLGHLLPNISAILFSFIPSIFVIFLTGSVIIESIFTVPGTLSGCKHSYR
jgi:ABC-type dipeptide/oligopeptide/nickel transport system permease component